MQILNLNEKHKSLEYHALICLNFKYIITLCYEHVIFHILNFIDINGIRWKVSILHKSVLHVLHARKLFL